MLASASVFISVLGGIFAVLIVPVALILLVKYINIYKIFNEHKKEVLDIGFCNCGEYAITSSSDSFLRLYDIKKNKLIKTFKHLSDSVVHFHFTKEGGYIYTVNLNKDVVKRKLFTEEIVSCVNLYKKGLDKNDENIKISSTFAFSKDSKLLAVGFIDGTIYVYNLKKDKFTNKYKAHYSRIISMDFNTKTNELISIGTDDIISRYDAYNNKVISKIKIEKDPKVFNIKKGGLEPEIKDLYEDLIKNTEDANETPITAADFSKDHKHVLCGFDNGEVTLFDTLTGKEIERYSVNKFRTSFYKVMITYVKFSNNDKYFACGNSSGVIIIWNLKNKHYKKELIKPKLSTAKGILPYYLGQVKSLVFSNDSKYLMSAIENEAIIWKTGIKE